MEMQSVSSPVYQNQNNYTLPATSNKNLSYKSEELSLEYKSKDGDTLSIQYSSQELAYSSTLPSDENAETAQADKAPYQLTPEEAANFRNQLKNELYDYKEEIIKNFIESNGGTYQRTNTAEDDPEVSDLEAKMPAYWNAENTAQRIADFATSFFSGYEGESSEYFKTIKEAIKAGFQEANDKLGQLPGPVGKLVNKTYGLVMDKLDAYEKQIAEQKTAEQAETALPFSAVA